MNAWRWRCLFLITLAGVGLCASPLEWKPTTLEVESAVGSDSVLLLFSYRNMSENKVKIETVESSCGCTTPSITKRTVEKEESGSISAIFSTKGRKGLNSAYITVKGVEIEGDVRRPFSDTLKLNVIVPEIVNITPGILLWKKDSLAVAKTIRFTVNKSLTLPLSLVEIEDNAFAGEWIEVEAGRIYELIVGPLSTKETRSTAVTVTGADREGKILRFQVHLLIR